MSYRENFQLIEWTPLPSLPRRREIEAARSSLPSPRIMSDAMAPVKSMLDGKLYDSKSALRATYRQAGVTEVGNDSARLKPRKREKRDRKVIKDTVEKAAARYSRGERSR